MAEAGVGDVSLPGVRDLFYTNLNVLGFDAVQSEVKYKIKFHEHMFDQPSKKGMEVVMYFLFYKLNEDLCYDKFRDCWPVFDKKQGQQFRKTCSEWITQISKESPYSDLPTTSMGLLLSPAGEKFYSFLLDLSTYVIQETIPKIAPKDFLVPNLSMEFEGDPILHDVHVNAMKRMIAFYSADVSRRLQLSADAHEMWRKQAGKLVGRYKDTCKQNKVLKRKLSDLQTLQREFAISRLPAVSPSVSTSSSEVRIQEEMSDATRIARMKKVKKLWKSVERFVSRNSHQREIIDAILAGNVDQHIVDAKELCFKIPELLVDRYGELFQQGLVGNTYEEDKLNISSLLTLWITSLEKVRDALQQAPIEVQQSTIVSSIQELQSCRAGLAKLSQKKSAVEKRTMEVKCSISKLRAELDLLNQQIGTGQLTAQAQPFVPMPQYTLPPLGICLQPPTPVKQPLPPSAINSSSTLNCSPTDVLSTPERVRQLVASVQRHAVVKEQPEIDSPPVTLPPQHAVLPVKADDVVRKKIDYSSDVDVNVKKKELYLLPQPSYHDKLSPAISNQDAGPLSPNNSDVDILASKIALYVMNDSNGSSPDPELLLHETTSSEGEDDLCMTPLQTCIASSDEALTPEVTELEWPIGVTPNINIVKAQISRNRKLQAETTQHSVDDLSSLPDDSEEHWLSPGNSGDTIFLVPTTPGPNKSQKDF